MQATEATPRPAILSPVILGLGVSPMRRREFIALLGSGVAAWPLAARAQQRTTPMVGYLSGGAPGPFASFLTAFREGLARTGYIEGQNVAIEYRWAEGDYDLIPGAAQGTAIYSASLTSQPAHAPF